MRIAILGASSSWYSGDLVRAAAGEIQLDCLPFSALASEISLDINQIFANEKQLPQYDAVLVRTMPPGSLEQVVFRMDALLQLEQQGTLVINPPKALEASIDKYLTLAILRRAGLPIPKTFVCQNVEDAMTGFMKLGGNVVVKPLFGGEGRGITRVSDEAIALRVFKTLAQLQAVIYLQEFIPHNGFDIRVLVIGDRVFGMRRHNRQDWRTNVSRGANGEAFQLSDELRELALSATKAVGAPLVGVDILPGQNGSLNLIEVNAVPGWKMLSQTLDTDIGRQVLDYLVARIHRSK